MSAGGSSRWPHRKRPDARALLGDTPVCFDTMILTALVEANRSQLLIELMAERARIVPRVAGELRGHCRRMPNLAAVMPPPAGALRPKRSFGESVQLSHAEAQRAADLQRAWNSKAVIDANPRCDRGEAECVAVCEERKWLLASQDHHAVGPPERRRQFVFGLPELLMLFAAEDRCLSTNAWNIYRTIAEGNIKLVAQHWPCNEESETLFAACCAEMATKAA